MHGLPNGIAIGNSKQGIQSLEQMDREMAAGNYSFSNLIGHQ